MAVADSFEWPSGLAIAIIGSSVLFLARAAWKLRWSVVFASRHHFVAVTCGWRQLTSFSRMARVLDRSKLKEAWDPRSSLLDLPRFAWTEMRLTLAPTEALLDAQRERERSPMHRRDYRVWRLRHAQSVAMFGLAIPTGVAASMALLCSSAAEVGGVVFLWLTLLLPMGLWLATRVRRQLVKNDGVPDQAVLQPLFKPE